MFQRQMKKYKLEIPNITEDEYNQTITTYKYDREIEMAMSLNTVKYYTNNDMDITNIELIGLSTDKYISKGDRLNKKYIVTFVEPNKAYTIVHLKEIDNNGRF